MNNRKSHAWGLGLRSLAFGAAMLGMALTGSAENWPQWRGPFFNGTTSETNLPVQWSTTENVALVAPLPGKSGATPVIWGDSVFVPSPDAQNNILLFCLSRLTGEVKWQKVVGTGDIQAGKNNMASPSAVTDGKRVIVLCGLGEMKAFDFSGREVWSMNLAQRYGKFANMWLYGASPLLLRNRLYVAVLQRNPPPYTHAQDDKPDRESFLLCLDPETGRELWRHIRKTDAEGESMESYATPYPYASDRGTEIVLMGADYVTAHRPETGEEIWRCGSLNPRRQQAYRIITSPTSSPGFIYVAMPKRNPLYAIREGGKGSVHESQIAWTMPEFAPDVCTPLYYRGKLFVLDGDRQMLTCLDPKNGEKRWQGNLGVREVFSASPTGADGKIYCFSERGTAVVLAAGDEFKILSTISMGEEPSMSSIAVAQGQLFIRTAKNIYCIGKSR